MSTSDPSSAAADTIRPPNADTPTSPSPSHSPPDTDPFSLSPTEEASLLEESIALKSTANTLFASASYSSAISTYDRALSHLPIYVEYERAVLKANIAAAHIKLGEWKEAAEAAGKAIEGLDLLSGNTGNTGKSEQGDEVEEVSDEVEARIAAFGRSGKTVGDVSRLRVKALMRRGRARSEMGSWSDLQGAQEDYKRALESEEELSGMDRASVDKALRELPRRIEAAQKREVDDMMGKLKDLGNGILKPFGLSTDNFAFTKDESTGGYSMNFNQGGKKG